MMKPEQTSVKAVIFDFDGTLADLNIDFALMRQAVEVILANHGIEPDGLRGLYILEMIEEATRLISKKNPLEGSRFLQCSLQLVTHHEIRAAKGGKILPGVITVFRLLEERGVKVGIITRNCAEAVKIVFPQVESFCHVFIPRDDVKRVKPHSDHLALALKKLDIKNPAGCFMVGDHVLDIEAGKRMDMKTIGVLTGQTTRQHFIEAGADLILDDVTKIPDHIFQE